MHAPCPHGAPALPVMSLVTCAPHPSGRSADRAPGAVRSGTARRPGRRRRRRDRALAGHGHNLGLGLGEHRMPPEDVCPVVRTRSAQRSDSGRGQERRSLCRRRRTPLSRPPRSRNGHHADVRLGWCVGQTVGWDQRPVPTGTRPLSPCRRRDRRSISGSLPRSTMDMAGGAGHSAAPFPACHCSHRHHIGGPRCRRH
jgi:hypothetical protein